MNAIIAFPEHKYTNIIVVPVSYYKNKLIFNSKFIEILYKILIYKYKARYNFRNIKAYNISTNI